jgi:hypothetical protein
MLEWVLRCGSTIRSPESTTYICPSKIDLTFKIGWWGWKREFGV